ncbi:hypothetical protein Y1Q_0005681 [Alligator mississippiensis]|uniref:Uncharacterized protein n=1 Tax=Alligator mississippiensis TaxID=8496 RepID=A0A151MFH1_ALLMI|nr:hypothetical protein Y1Q_0005681 [Alligator mississippiensis]
MGNWVPSNSACGEGSPWRVHCVWWLALARGRCSSSHVCWEGRLQTGALSGLVLPLCRQEGPASPWGSSKRWIFPMPTPEPTFRRLLHAGGLAAV